MLFLSPSQQCQRTKGKTVGPKCHTVNHICISPDTCLWFGRVIGRHVPAPVGDQSTVQLTTGSFSVRARTTAVVHRSTSASFPLNSKRSQQRSIVNSLCPLFNGHFPGGSGLAYQNVSIPDFVGAKGDRSGGNNWSYEVCKAPVKILPPTNQHLVFLQAECPSFRPTTSVKPLKGKLHRHYHF